MERLYVGIVRRLAGSAEVELHLVPLRPVVQRYGGELDYGQTVPAHLHRGPAPVPRPRAPGLSPYQVSKELGHGGDQLVKRVYGHLGEVRHRSELLEHRTDQHEEAARERLEMLRAHPK